VILLIIGAYYPRLAIFILRCLSRRC